MSKQEKLLELLKNEEYVLKLSQFDTIEDLQAEFKSKDIEMTTQEIEKLIELLAISLDENRELTLDELEQITGGFSNLVVGLAVGTSLIGGGIAALVNKFKPKKSKPKVEFKRQNSFPTKKLK